MYLTCGKTLYHIHRQRKMILLESPHEKDIYHQITPDWPTTDPIEIIFY